MESLSVLIKDLDVIIIRGYGKAFSELDDIGQDAGKKWLEPFPVYKKKDQQQYDQDNAGPKWT